MGQKFTARLAWVNKKALQLLETTSNLSSRADPESIAVGRENSSTTCPHALTLCPSRLDVRTALQLVRSHIQYPKGSQQAILLWRFIEFCFAAAR